MMPEKERLFYYDAYSKILPDFIEAFKMSEQNIEILFSNISSLFSNVLDLPNFTNSLFILWFDNDVLDGKLDTLFCESPDFSQEELAEELEKAREEIVNGYVDSPKIFDQALVIPITYAYITYGYVLIFFHNDKVPYADNCPQVNFLYKTMYLAALAFKERFSMERFEYYLMNDLVTDMPNRTHIYEAIVYSLQTAEALETRFALLIVRVNTLKHINNSLGMITGDMMLKEVGGLIQSAIFLPEMHSNAMIGRLSGGDFVVLITFPAGSEDEENTDLVQKNRAVIKTYCEAILNKIKENIEINGYKIYPSINMGASIFPLHGETPELLLSKADIAKSIARQEGHNTYKIYEEIMDGDSEKALFLHNNFPIAVDTNQFELFYQAKMDMTSGLITGAEALIRWHHPEKGMLFPGDFIQFAEENGYGIRVDKLVLEMALEQIIKWSDRDLSISVNISPKHFENGLIYDTISKMLKYKSVDPKKLKVELLESVLLDDFDVAVKVIKDLMALGVNIALDDFGAGYSSLEYVAKLPMDFLKIDRTFTMNLLENPSNKIILETIMTLAKGMKVKTIAEGVESQYHFDFLKSIGCDIAQGYFINKPMPVAEFEELLERNRAGL